MNTAVKRLGTGVIARAVVGIIVASMLGFLAAGSQAAALGTSAHRPVLSSDYGKMTSHIKGTFGNGGTVTGKFTPRRFLVNGAGELVAAGKLRATLTRASGKVVGTETKHVRIPVRTIGGVAPTARTAANMRAASCDILNLVLGPLDLDLLGLQVHLDKVVLKIDAAPGAGNLLGNLLCAVAGLLDGGQSGLLTQISQILNSILAILRLP